MLKNHHPGAQWTARRVTFLCVLMAALALLVTGVTLSNGRDANAVLPPDPLAEHIILNPLPPTDTPALPQGEDIQLAATAGCTRSFCAYLPMVGSGSQAPGGSTLSRASAVNLYRQSYVPAGNVQPGWTGSVDSCNPGQTSAAFRQAVLARLNYFRVMAGIPALEGLDDLYNSLDQQAALMMSANNQLSHSPPNSWRCFTQAGRDGAGSSNLYLGDYGPNAITGYMRDPGAGNTAAGHRRWILYPQNRRMGTGDIPAGNGYAYANALRSWDSNFGGPRPATRDTFVAWPPATYVPYPVVFARWSFAYPNANFDGASVSVTHNGADVPVTRFTPAYGFGEPTLVWQINGMNDGATWPRPGGDDPYVVTIRNVVIDGKARDFTYTVTIINAD